jgi:hypothetical protein
MRALSRIGDVDVPAGIGCHTERMLELAVARAPGAPHVRRNMPVPSNFWIRPWS